MLPFWSLYYAEQLAASGFWCVDLLVEVSPPRRNKWIYTRKPDALVADVG
jgi:hypothetical protein